MLIAGTMAYAVKPSIQIGEVRVGNRQGSFCLSSICGEIRWVCWLTELTLL